MLVRTARCRQAVRVSERVRVREIDDDEGKRLLRIIRRGSGVGGDLAAGPDGAAVRANATATGTPGNTEHGLHAPWPVCWAYQQNRSACSMTRTASTVRCPATC